MIKAFVRFFLPLGIAATSCALEAKDDANELLSSRFELLLTHPVEERGIPRSYSPETGELEVTSSRAWTSGFFPGNLWLVYRLTGDAAYAEKAEEWTALLEREQLNGRDHDIGFRVGSSFGLGYRLTGQEAYEAVIVQSARTLCTRFSDTVGSIRSWGASKSQWQYPVIIDNMMNLELLFEAWKLSGDERFYEVAVRHANTTLQNHFRADGSTFHVVDYDPETGVARQKNTHQGFSDESAWARGQAWAIYGFTMAYRYTKDERYLAQARKTARFFLQHPRLPEDGIPYWDFDDPKIPNVPRDSSAAAIVCSALFELYGATEEGYFLEQAKRLLESLQSKAYVLDASLEIPFLLDKSTGNLNRQSEVEVPITYADYYLLEALARSRSLATR